jgi:hypothetical protein
MVLGIGLIGCFVAYTGSMYYKLTGKWQFSPFTGWQMANNAMYAYRYVDDQHTNDPPRSFRQLDKMVRNYFDTTKDFKKHPEEALQASTVYMWTPTAPLQQYMQIQFKGDHFSGNTKRWATVAPLYADYGSYIIRRYPVAFARYYLWPNTIKYYAPPIEFLEYYSMGIDSVAPIAQSWFRYKNNKLRTYSKNLKVFTLGFYPVLTGMINVVFLLGSLAFLYLKLYKQYRMLGRGIILTGSLWIVNFGFSVFASPIALRFQLFPILISFSFCFLSMEAILKAGMANLNNEKI